jgi:hypothetical protein
MIWAARSSVCGNKWPYTDNVIVGEPKQADEPHQFEVSIARIIFAGEGKKLVERRPC